MALHPNPALPRAFIGQGLTKIYTNGDAKVHALRSIDLEIFEGEVLVLLGPSGSGKSTLLNILGGLDRPTAGQLQYRDHDLAAADDGDLTRFRRQHVGFIFQFYNLLPSLTARENVALVTDISDHPMPAEEALALVPGSDALGHGFRVEGTIILWQDENVLRVPVGALVRSEDGSWRVYVDRAGRARARKVTIGHMNSDYAEVLGGLEEGDAVIIGPGGRISDGSRVRVR